MGKRVCPVSEYMLVQKRERATLTPYGERFGNNKGCKNDIRATDFTHNPQFRQLIRTNMVVGRLVQHIVAQWRESFSRNIAMKYNCYFLLPFINEFHRYLRQEMQKVYEGKGDNLCDVFDIISARKSLIKLREDLTSECTANMRLQEKFFIVSRMMSERQQKPNENSSSL